MTRNRSLSQWMLFATVLAGSLVASKTFSQSSQSTQKPASPSSTSAKSSGLSTFVPRQAQMYYLGLWGIDSLRVKYTESGEMVRFTYRVVDPVKAAPLNNGKAEPYLYDAQAGVKLVVPQMEKIGKLRQSSTPIEGKSYWMAFSNVGRRVRPGDRVSIEIGPFRAMNLVVE